MLANYLTSVTRTWVPILVGLVVTWLGRHFHVVLSSGTSDQLTLVVGGVVIAAYYALVRLLEERFPQLGWLLGKPTKPNYAQLQTDGSYLVTDLGQDLLGNFGPDPLRIEGSDPNVPGAGLPGAATAGGIGSPEPVG